MKTIVITGASGGIGAATAKLLASRGNAIVLIARREKELADFLENAAEGLHRVGRDGTILWANAAELEMLGYAEDEYVGHGIAEF